MTRRPLLMLHAAAASLLLALKAIRLRKDLPPLLGSLFPLGQAIYCSCTLERTAVSALYVRRCKTMQTVWNLNVRALLSQIANYPKCAAATQVPAYT